MISELLASAGLVFVVIFGFELVDRTNFGVIALAARHPRRAVWEGASLAFLASTALAVLLGLAAISLLAPYLLWVKVAGGLILLAFGVRGLFAGDPTEEEKADQASEAPLTPAQVRSVAFSLILFLEMGDNTQVLTILFVASTKNVLLVFVSAALALVSVAAIGARSGEFLRSRVPARRLERYLSGVLCVVGLLTILIALEPGLIPFL
ncbi:MAG TPA: TMEM165/GDT1 family protein [Thermoplasmata archaeon]|nr:TMEM165/GDT1 family protein [Thermoplasmata archaeon]